MNRLFFKRPNYSDRIRNAELPIHVVTPEEGTKILTSGLRVFVIVNMI